jgi:hypothetical protein
MPDSPDYLRGVEAAAEWLERDDTRPSPVSRAEAAKMLRAALMPKAPTVQEVVAQYLYDERDTDVRYEALITKLRALDLAGVANFLRALRAWDARDADSGGAATPATGAEVLAQADAAGLGDIDAEEMLRKVGRAAPCPGCKGTGYQSAGDDRIGTWPCPLCLARRSGAQKDSGGAATPASDSADLGAAEGKNRDRAAGSSALTNEGRQLQHAARTWPRAQREPWGPIPGAGPAPPLTRADVAEMIAAERERVAEALDRCADATRTATGHVQSQVYDVVARCVRTAGKAGG